jgi:hypothetical protein
VRNAPVASLNATPARLKKSFSVIKSRM